MELDNDRIPLFIFSVISRSPVIFGIPGVIWSNPTLHSDEPAKNWWGLINPHIQKIFSLRPNYLFRLKLSVRRVMTLIKMVLKFILVAHSIDEYGTSKCAK